MSVPSLSPSGLSEGDVVAGRYRVKRLVGRGGVGAVVEAQDVEQGRLVAVKVMLRGALGNAELVARFQREARLVARMRGEHVIRIFDVGSVDGRPYMVMELLRGSDLATVLAKRGPIPWQEVAGYMLQACLALAEAHGAGLVHRDIKPTNLFLCDEPGREPVIKVLDFGVAKGEVEGVAITQTQSVLGSPVYMSPECMRSAKNADSRSDMWSLGVCFYELVSGVAPFDAPTLPLLSVRILNETPRPIAELRPELPAPIADAIMRCLVKEPRDRMQTVADLAAAIAPFAPSSKVTAAEVARVLGTPRSSSDAIDVDESTLELPPHAQDEALDAPVGALHEGFDGEASTLEMPPRKQDAEVSAARRRGGTKLLPTKTMPVHGFRAPPSAPSSSPSPSPVPPAEESATRPILLGIGLGLALVAAVFAVLYLLRAH